MYDNACEVKPAGALVNDAPRRTMADIARDTQGMLKELLKLMIDTEIVLFGKPSIPPVDDKRQEPQCLAEDLMLLEENARSALNRYMELRRRMV